MALAVGAIDQTSKALAIGSLSNGDRIPLLGDLLGLQLAFNPGTVMSLGSGSTWILTLVSSVATVALLVAAARAKSLGWAVAIGFVWGGAAGNLIDRLFADPAPGRGHVTDFLAYGDLFIGNLADVALGVGAVIVVALLVRRRPNGTITGEPDVKAGSD
ncbi:signal peptidase II [Amnibacterium flavum]|uniref:signal peptidase II n=1 Tax=Amnibacterium flavum TaxID=2173173 RepID=UPI001F0C2A6D|nr:signal peptidase II [Amnibacterium flavum]